jgi:hypothetical protein
MIQKNALGYPGHFLISQIKLRNDPLLIGLLGQSAFDWAPFGAIGWRQMNGVRARFLLLPP